MDIPNKIYAGHIEYVRLDDFIEKASKWLKENAYFYVDDYTGSLNEDMLVSKFKKAMKDISNTIKDEGTNSKRH